MENSQGLPLSHEQTNAVSGDIKLPIQENHVALGMGILKFKFYKAHLFSLLHVFKPKQSPWDTGVPRCINTIST